MKRIVRFFIVTLLATATGLAGTSFLAINNTSVQAQAPARVEEIAVPLALPSLANISLNERSTKTAQVVAIDAQKQELRLQNQGKTEAVPLERVDQVKFKDDAPIFVGGRPLIRGPSSKGEKRTWDNVSINAFSLLEASTGQALVRLGSSSIDQYERESIQQVIRGNGRDPGGFIVDVIKFDLEEGTMLIEAIPY